MHIQLPSIAASFLYRLPDGVHGGLAEHSRILGKRSSLRQAQDDVAEALLGPLPSLEAIIGFLGDRDRLRCHVRVHMHMKLMNLSESMAKLLEEEGIDGFK